MGYNIAGFIADRRLTDEEMLGLFDGAVAAGPTKFEGWNDGVADIIRGEDFTFGITSLVNVNDVKLAKGELVTFIIESTSGSNILHRYVDGVQTDEHVNVEGEQFVAEGDAFPGFEEDPWDYIEEYIKKRTGLTSEIWEQSEFERYTF